MNESIYGSSIEPQYVGLDYWVPGDYTAPRNDKLLIGKPRHDLAKQLLALERRISRLVICHLTGYCHLRKHVNIMGLTDDRINKTAAVNIISEINDFEFD